jgi:hypothetical protein
MGSYFYAVVIGAIVLAVWRWMQSIEYAGVVLFITVALWGYLLPGDVDMILYVIAAVMIAKSILLRPFTTKYTPG